VLVISGSSIFYLCAAAFDWMSDIAAQLALLSAAQINGIPTNVNIVLGESATAADVVRVVVK